MKLPIVGILIVLANIPTVVVGQVYTENFNFQLNDGLQGPGFDQSFTITGNAVDTITIDQGAGTLAQSLTITPDALTVGPVSGSQIQTLPAQFPNPPQQVSGDGTAQIEIGITPIIVSTPPLNLTYSGMDAWQIPSASSPVEIPFNFSYTVFSGGQTFSDSGQASISAAVMLPTQLNTASYPTSISVSPAPQFVLQSGTVLLNMTAADGFTATIRTIPEPDTALLLGMGVWSFCLAAKGTANRDS